MKNRAISPLAVSIVLVHLLGLAPVRASGAGLPAPAEALAEPSAGPATALAASAAAGNETRQTAPPAVSAADRTLAPRLYYVWTVNAADDVDDGTCDASHCSLREAVNAAYASDVIDFAPGLAGATITVSRPITIAKSTLTIASDLTPRVRVSGGNATRVFTIDGCSLGCSVEIQGLEITWGNAAIGGGIYVGAVSDLTLSNVLMTHHHAYTGLGSAIYAADTAQLTIENCTFESNETAVTYLISTQDAYITGSTFANNPNVSGVLDIRYSPSLYDAVTVVNSTFTDNGYQAIYNDGAQTTLRNVTISNHVIGLQNERNLDMFNTLIANNTQDCVLGAGGNIGAYSRNLVEDGSCYPDVTGDPSLGPLQNNGGPTQTRALLPGSPAIDAGDDAACAATDQRGVSRPRDGNGDLVMACDIGAFEVEGPVVVNSADDADDGACNQTHCSLREAVNHSSSEATVIFTPALSGAAITLTSALDVNRSLTIDASALADRVAISGNNLYRVFYQSSGTNLVLRYLRLIDGFRSASFGGCIYGSGSLTLEDSEVIHCVGQYAGAIYAVNDLTLIRTRIADSSASDTGVVYVQGALQAIDSTFESNQASGYGVVYAPGTLDVSGSAFWGNVSSSSILYAGDGAITNTTFSGNSAYAVIDQVSWKTLTLQNVTIAGNNGYGVSNNGALNLFNTIIAHNTSGNCLGFPSAASHSLQYPGASCGGAIPTADPLLGPLEDNGGDTLTRALLAGSPAIDAGDAVSCPAFDQRGVERPKDGDDNGVAACDIGAFELTNDMDYGDAPAPYPTSKAANGARHYLRTGYYMGAQVDIDPDGFPTAGADGDDLNNLDDEDGVTFLTPVRANDSASVQVTISRAGYLHAWLDFNADGDWADAGEKIIAGVYRPAGTHTFAFQTPPEASIGNTAARFRFTTRPRLSYDGIAIDGEVEDYIVAIQRGRPLAGNDSASLDENTTVLIDVLANDDDPHGTIALQSVGPAARGATAIESGQIRYTPVPDYNGSDSFRYTIVSDIGLTQTARVNIFVRNVNSRPTDIQVLNQQALIAGCNSSGVCTLPAGTLVGTLRAIDPDPGDSHTFNVLGGEFQVNGGMLYTAAPIVFTGNTQMVTRQATVRAVDAGGLTYDKAFTFFILGDRVGGGPTGITLSNHQVMENLAAGTLVGALTASEETPRPPYTYSLVPGPGSNENGLFQISGNRLETAQALDFESRELYRVRVRAQNNMGQFTDATFTIQALDDVSEPPAPPPNCSGANIELIDAYTDNGDHVQMSVGSVIASNVTVDGCDVEGELFLTVPGLSISGIAFEGEVDERNQVTADGGQIAPFDLTVAGVLLRTTRSSLEVYDGRYGLRLERASFCLPDEWGGLCAPATAGGVSMLIDDSGLKIGGELEIGFPEIRVGSQLNLSGLRGKIEPVPGGYEITLAGEFGLPKFQPGGASGCGISASVTIYAGAGGALVMEIHTLSPEETAAVRLREISLGLECDRGIPIDSTGLQVSGIEGTVSLRPSDQYVSLVLTVTSIQKVPVLDIPIVKGVGTATLHWDPRWQLDMESVWTLLRVFEFARTKATIYENGYTFTAHFTAWYSLVNGDITVSIWTDWYKLHLAGRGEVKVGFVKGSVWEGCVDLGLFEACASIPPWDMNIPFGAEFGEFTNGAWGVKGYVTILGKSYGVYIDTAPSLHAGGVDQYRLVSPAQVRAALAQRRGGGQWARIEPLAQSAAVRAAADNQVVLRVPVGLGAEENRVQDQRVTPIQLDTPRDALFVLGSSKPLTMTLQAPDGTVITPNNYAQPPVVPTYAVTYTHFFFYQAPPDTSGVPEEPRLRFVTVATDPTWEEADLSLDGVLLFDHQRIETPEPLYVPIYGGERGLSAAPSTGGTPITATFDAAALTHYTALLSGDGVAPVLTVLTDDLAAPSAQGLARVRFVHSAPYTGSVNVFIEGAQVLTDAVYLDASAAFEFPAGEALVEVKDAVTGLDVAPPQVVDLAAGAVYSLFDFVHPQDAYQLAWTCFLDMAYQEQYYTQYIVAQAPAGTWEVTLEGDLDNALPIFAALGVANPPRWERLEAQAGSDPFHPELTWELQSDYLPTTVSLYANPGAYEESGEPVYQGYLIAEVDLTTPGQVSGDPFAQAVDLSAMESGDYTLWARVDDGVNPPISAYALTPGDGVAVFAIDQSATFPVAWTPAITTEVSGEQARMFLEWEALMHPDVDSYNLYVSTRPLSPTLYTAGLSAFAERDANGQPTGSVQANASVSNLVPGETYYYSVEAVDADGGRSVRSPEASIVIPTGNFRLTTPSAQYLVAAGSQITFPLSMQTLSPLFYPNVGLSIDTSQTAPGMRVWFDSPLGGDAYLTEQASSVTVAVDLLDTVPPGIYPVTFTGVNGNLRRTRTVYILVAPPPSTDLQINGRYELDHSAGQERVVLTFTVVNAGPGRGDGATVSIPLPPEITGATWTCVGTGGATCGSGEGDVVDAIGNLLPGATATYTITGAYERYLPFEVTASVEWLGIDADLTNNHLTLKRWVSILMPVFKNASL